MNAVLKPAQFNNEVVIVTPQIAEQWLSANTNNRQVKKTHVKRMSAAMVRGEWILNGETVKFDANGRLVDGQHRLRAVVEAGVNVPIEVRYNVPVDAFATIDTGVVRGAKDALYTHGVGNNTYDIAAAARIAFHGLNSSIERVFYGSSVALSNKQVVQFVEAHSSLVDLTTELYEREVRKLCPLSLAAGVFWLIIYKHSRAAVNPFLDAFLSGESLTAEHPAYILRERLIAERIGHSRGTRRRIETCAFIIAAWNAYHTGRPLKVLRLRRNDAFPTIA